MGIENVNIREMYLGDAINAFITYVVDDCEVWYTIFLNDALCEEKKRKALQHELEHIRRGDFDSMIPAAQLESIAHDLTA